MNPSLEPLVFFYDKLDLPVPEINDLSAEDLPSPYRELLAHERDMTPTLETHHGHHIHLQVLHKNVSASHVRRMVQLRLDDSEKIVEFGAINIHLDAFDEVARDLLSEGRVPLGTILHKHDIPHRSLKRSYFSVVIGSKLEKALEIPSGSLCYGRCNFMVGAGEIPVAEIVEILPPSSGTC